jgi:hypothetical protein
MENKKCFDTVDARYKHEDVLVHLGKSKEIILKTKRFNAEI